MRKLRSALALSLVVTHLTACIETDGLGPAGTTVAFDEAAEAPPPQERAEAPPENAEDLPEVPEPTTLAEQPVVQPALAANGGQSCYAVQVQHFTYPDNNESSPRCTWYEWTAATGWTLKVVPFPVAVHNADTKQGGLATWFVWSGKNVCEDTKPVSPYGNLGLAPTENRLLAATVADLACGFARYTVTPTAVRTQGRYDKDFLWGGPGTPNRDFRCWKIPDPPAPVPGQPAPELTAQQQACQLVRGANNIDPPAPPAPPPVPPPFISIESTADRDLGGDEATDAATSDADAGLGGVDETPPGGSEPPPAPPPIPDPSLEVDTTRIITTVPGDSGYTIEYITERVSPGALAEIVPGATGLFGAEVVAAFGGAYAIVRTRDATGAIVLDEAGVVTHDALAGVDTWGPITESEASAINSFDPPSASGSGSDWMSAYGGAGTDPNDPFFGTGALGHPGGSEPARTGTPSPAHSGGTHATSTAQPTTPGARPTAYTGSTHPPGGQATAHAQFRPPTTNPWTRPRPTGQVATEVVSALQHEHSRAAAQARGAADVVARERTALTRVNERVTAARTAEADARRALEAAPTDAARGQAAVRASLELANQMGQQEVRQAAFDAAEAARIQAANHETLARITHQLEVKLQELEVAEAASGQPNQNLRTEASNLALGRDLAEQLVTGQPAPGVMQRLGALAGRLAAESPINPNLPAEVRARIANHRQWKVHHLTAIPVALVAAVLAVMTGGMGAAVALLTPVAFHAWRAITHHVTAEALNRGAAPSALPDPSGGLPPGGGGGGGGSGGGGGPGGVTPPPAP